MAGRTCHHCKQRIEDVATHDCWTTTEAALTRDLPEELQDAWQRLRETAVALGAQRIYASHHSIMFSRTACYFFVRPTPKCLEVCVFLGRSLNAPQVRRVVRVSRVKFAHLLRIRHRDEAEAPITDWIQEAYDASERLTALARAKGAASNRSTRKKKTMRAGGRKKRLASRR